MLEKKISYDYSVTENGHIQVRQIIKILENNKLLSTAYKRHVIVPGADVSNENIDVKRLAWALHTQECIKAYQVKTGSI